MNPEQHRTYKKNRKCVPVKTFKKMKDLDHKYRATVDIYSRSSESSKGRDRSSEKKKKTMERILNMSALNESIILNKSLDHPLTANYSDLSTPARDRKVEFKLKNKYIKENQPSLCKNDK